MCQVKKGTDISEMKLVNPFHMCCCEEVDEKSYVKIHSICIMCAHN